ncbi:uncharacterized protein G2W53_009058 [Senna tora]|uniref:Uncharacterized protein n=1 Tax=Senna tora TaxID=362788 RepID=A0A834WXI2_9FABA|nr:uncharacterized protein G2W53_009058 [Senna tora]
MAKSLPTLWSPALYNLFKEGRKNRCVQLSNPCTLGKAMRN